MSPFAFRKGFLAPLATFVVLGWAVFLIGNLSKADDAEGTQFFERKVRPLLSTHCYECHSRSAKRPEGGLRLDTAAGIRAGGENGALLNASKLETSLLLEVLHYGGDIQMPPRGKLPADELVIIEEWVKRGAPLPDDDSAASATKGIDFAAGRKFWSFQPLQSIPPRRPPSEAGVRNNRTDLYLLDRLAEQGLAYSPEADRRNLIRRATYDLLGLPPTPEEVDAFASDAAPDAYEQLIDRLLASPQYGESWGRHWLDLARYADANETSLEVRAQAWLYRDWVVEALNSDLPYNEFVRRQLAADKIAGLPRRELAALGFLAISPEYFKELKLAPNLIQAIVADEWEERIDAIGRTYLGLSLACARCHDHKFDPVSTEDYYALAGVLASSRLTEQWIISDEEAGVVQKAHAEVNGLAAEIKKLKGIKQRSKEEQARLDELENRSRDIEKTTPYYRSGKAHSVDDAALYVVADGPANTKLDYKPGQAQDVAVQIRGNPAKPGAIVPRRFLTLFAPSAPQKFSQGSGRLELADAILGQAGPLAARVIVNRVWALHFGRGLTETVSDFGTQGERPSHPELLDDLAGRFIADGWSLKKLHREIMLSAAYRQSSAHGAKGARIDPDNRLLGRMNRRRLSIEAWRDSLLFVAGTLDLRFGDAPRELASPENRRRTLYGQIDRSAPDDLLRLFDFPDPSAHAPGRLPTTTPLQQLFVLNGPLMTRQASELAQLISSQATPAETVRAAYRRILMRLPTESELRLGVAYLSPAPTPAAVRQYIQALLGSNEFMFLD